MRVLNAFRRLRNNDKGATAIEYALIAALIGVAAIGAMQGVGGAINTKLGTVSTALTTGG